MSKVVGDTVFNILRVNDLELIEGTERPLYPPTIKSIEVITNPFNDMVPRITAMERREQNRARDEMKQKAKDSKGPKRKGTK